MAYWIGTYIVEILKLNVVMFLFFTFLIRQKYKRFAAMYIIGLIMVVAISNVDIEKSIIMNLITMVIIISTMGTIKSLVKSFIIIPIYLGISLIDVLIGVLFLLITKYNAYLILENKFHSFLINSISLIIYLLIVLLISKKRKILINYTKAYDNRRYMIFFTVGIIIIILCFIPIQVNGFNSDDINLRIYYYIGMAISVIMFIIISVMFAYISYRNKYHEEESKSNKMLLIKQKGYYKKKIEESDVEKSHHDIGIMLFRFKQYLEDENIVRAKEYLDNMEGKFIRCFSGIETGNDTLNIVVDYIFSMYERGKVPIEWEGEFPENITMLDIDICILFSNLLTNAVQSEINTHEIYKETEKEYCAVKVSIKYIEKSIFFTIKNRVTGEVEVVENILKTKKQDKKRHGFGSINVFEIIEKYEGSIEYKQEKDIFIVEGVLYNVIE